jgi:hypothetical protein
VRPETLRVASPLVMARHGLRDGPRGWSLSRWGVWETLIHYLLLRRGVVPHETPNDSDVRFSGFAALRLRKHLLQSAPERAKAAVANRRFAPPPVASAHAYRGRRCGVSLWCNPRQSERKRRSRTAGSPRRQSRALMHRPISAPSDSLRGELARASESGHLKRSFSSPPVASAQITIEEI